jgi:hypothetical protein
LARHPELDKLHARQLPGVNCGPAGIPMEYRASALTSRVQISELEWMPAGRKFTATSQSLPAWTSFIGVQAVKW